ncbi:MAG: hypothetical protein M0020_05100 [Actinomycetota bacterium]|nr:hypothetical protein [Actinomycetota bacterium]
MRTTELVTALIEAFVGTQVDDPDREVLLTDRADLHFSIRAHVVGVEDVVTGGRVVP